jgi:SET domain-containing protein
LKTATKEEDFKQSNSIEAPESDYLFIKASQIPNAGQGLYTAVDIYEDEIITLFKGEILSNKEAKKRVDQNDDEYFINLLDGTIMDSKHTDCYAKYANDAEGLSKSKFKNNSKITLDDEDRVCVQASKDIKSGEELFCGYGKSYWKKHKDSLLAKS